MMPPELIFHSSARDLPWSRTVAYRLTHRLIGSLDTAIPTLQALDHESATSRWAGFINYDVGRCFEELPARAVDDLHLPAVCFARCADDPPNYFRPRPSPVHSTANPIANFTRDRYEQAVQRCIDYITAGDVFQINLSQRFAVPISEDSWTVYERLRQMFPADFGAHLNFGDFKLISNSPELFLRVTKLPDGGRKIVNRPIKGTRPNAPGMADALLRSEKDKAELAMIVDLQRNDLGRICEVGSVRVTEPRTIETHPTVLHGVATVEGILRPDVTLTDILRATFPCGSVTGCPKIRAMEIIDEIEPVRRGAYCGAIGWVGHDEMELAVAIRTMTIKDGICYIPVGGGIVADSSPAAEYEETLVKAKAMFAALGV